MSISINIYFIHQYLVRKLQYALSPIAYDINYDEKQCYEHPYQWTDRYSLAVDFDTVKMYKYARNEWIILSFEVPNRYAIFENLAEDDIRLEHNHQASTAFIKCICDLKHNQYKPPLTPKEFLRDFPNIRDNTKLSNICKEYIYAGFISQSNPRTSSLFYQMVINSKYRTTFLDPVFRKFP